MSFFGGDDVLVEATFGGTGFLKRVGSMTSEVDALFAVGVVVGASSLPLALGLDVLLDLLVSDVRLFSVVAVVVDRVCVCVFGIVCSRRRR